MHNTEEYRKKLIKLGMKRGRPVYLVQFDIKGENCGGVEVYVEPHEWFHMDDCRVVPGYLSQSQIPLSHGGQAP